MLFTAGKCKLWTLPGSQFDPKPRHRLRKGGKVDQHFLLKFDCLSLFFLVNSCGIKRLKEILTLLFCMSTQLTTNEP